REAGKRIHVLHVTTNEEIDFLADNKDIATVEITPQHLTLVAPEAYERLKGLAQMNPPIRDQYHVNGLWRGIVQGVAVGHAGRADPATGHAQPRRQWPPQPGAVGRPDVRRRAARLRRRRQGAHG